MGDERVSTGEASTGRAGGLVRGRATGVFSPRAFVAAVLLTGVGLLAASAAIPLPLSGLLGVFAAAFVFGAVADRRRYAEVASAAGLVAAASVVTDYLVWTVFGGVGVPLLAVGGALGAAAGAAGVYFGRDLRAGLTRDLG